MDTKTIFVVDDDDDVLGVTEEILRSFGHESVLAHDCADALDLWEEKRGAIHLVLLDYTLPDGSGLELAERFVQESPALPIVLMSGFAADLTQASEELRRNLVLLDKPFAVAQLRETLARIFPLAGSREECLDVDRK